VNCTLLYNQIKKSSSAESKIFGRQGFGDPKRPCKELADIYYIVRSWRNTNTTNMALRRVWPHNKVDRHQSKSSDQAPGGS